MIMRFIESQIKTKAKIVKHGYSIDNTLQDKIRVTIVAAGITDFSDKKANQQRLDFDPSEEREVSPFDTFGMPGLAKAKPAKKKAEAEEKSQFGLFEAEEKLRETVTTFAKDKSVKKDIENVPAYMRYGLDLVDIDEIPEENRVISRI